MHSPVHNYLNHRILGLLPFFSGLWFSATAAGSMCPHCLVSWLLSAVILVPSSNYIVTILLNIWLLRTQEWGENCYYIIYPLLLSKHLTGLYSWIICNMCVTGRCWPRVLFVSLSFISNTTTSCLFSKVAKDCSDSGVLCYSVQHHFILTNTTAGTARHCWGSVPPQ